MSNRIPVVCPSCRSTLKLRPEYFGRGLICKRCQHRFISSEADLADPTTAPPAEKIDFDCPACRKSLRIRAHHLGMRVICKKCQHSFIAPLRSSDGPPAWPSGRVEDSRRDEIERAREDLEREFDLVGRLERLQDRAEELHSAGHGWDERVERSAAELERHGRDLAGLEAGLSAIRAEFEAFRGSAALGWEAERRALADGLRAELAGLQSELEGLRRQEVESARLAEAAGVRSAALESRLGPLEQAGGPIGERLRSLEVAEAEHRAVAEELQRLVDRCHSLQRAADGHAEELAAGRSEHSSLRTALGEHEERHLALEAGLRSLEVASAGSGRDERVERSAAELERHRRDFAGLDASLSAVRAEFEAFRGSAASGWEADRLALADGLRAELAGLHSELEGLRRQEAESARLAEAAGSRSAALESRLGPLEAASRQAAEQGGLIEAAEAERRTIVEELERLRDQSRSLRQAADGHAEELRAGLAAGRSEHSSLRAALGEHDERLPALEVGLRTLEAARLEAEREAADRRESSEAAWLAIREEIGRLHELVRQVVDHQAGRDGRLEAAIGRLDAIESERTSLPREQGARVDQDELRRELLAHFEQSQAELAGLRAELMTLTTRTTSPSPSAPAPDGPRPIAVEPRPTPSVAFAASPVLAFGSVLDQLVQDLALDQLFRAGGPPEPEGPAPLPANPPSLAGASGPSSPKPKPPVAAISPEYNQLRDRFARSIDRGDHVGAVAAARELVSYTRDHFGEDRLEHALWLRNLAMSLSTAGESAEALATLRRALEVCEANPGADQFPHAICLIDLAELYLAAGDDRRAEAPCRRALAILEGLNVGSGSPLMRKAQICMDRIGTMGVDLSSFNSVSILT